MGLSTIFSIRSGTYLVLHLLLQLSDTIPRWDFFCLLLLLPAEKGGKKGPLEGKGSRVHSKGGGGED